MHARAGQRHVHPTSVHTGVSSRGGRRSCAAAVVLLRTSWPREAHSRDASNHFFISHVRTPDSSPEMGPRARALAVVTAGCAQSCRLALHGGKAHA